MIRKNSFISVSIIFIFSCNQSGNSSKHVLKDERDSIFSLSLEIIKREETPLDGCSCYYSHNNEDFKSRNFFFLSEAETGYIKLNGKVIALSLGNSVFDSYDNFKEQYYNDTLVLFVSGKKLSNTDESSFYEAKIELIAHGKKKFIFDGVGECGC